MFDIGNEGQGDEAQQWCSEYQNLKKILYNDSNIFSVVIALKKNKTKAYY